MEEEMAENKVKQLEKYFKVITESLI